jgi:hypothetical protein
MRCPWRTHLTRLAAGRRPQASHARPGPFTRGTPARNGHPPPPSRVLQYCDRCLMADGDVMMADGDVMTRCMTVAGDALDGGPAS